MEACASPRSVKYLHRYFFKHPGAAIVRIVERNPGQPHNENDPVDGNRQLEHNELSFYLITRYLWAMEAAQHINQFHMHLTSHHVYRIRVHLRQRQRVVFEQGRERQAFERNENTMLTGWFKLNRTDPEAR